MVFLALTLTALGCDQDESDGSPAASSSGSGGNQSESGGSSAAGGSRVGGASGNPSTASGGESGGPTGSGGMAGAAAAGAGGVAGAGGSAGAPPVAGGQAGAGGAGGNAGGVAGAAGGNTGGNAGAGGAGTSGAGASGSGNDGPIPNRDAVVAPSGGTCGTKWTNPGKQGVHDPSIVKQGDTYYMFATGGFGFSSSKDKLTWARGSSGVSGPSAWTQTLGLAGGPSIWACDAQLVGGRALVYYSVSSWGDVTHSAIGLMTNVSFDPAAPGYKWVDRGKVVGSPEGGSGVNVIDPNLLIDDDGKWWLVYGSFHKGVRLIELDPATGLAKNDPPKPVTLTTSLGEGSSLIKANGYYYLFVSRGHCCDGLKSTYEVVYGRASKIDGPYVNRAGQGMNTDYEKLLAAGQDGNPGQGGQSLFQENGQWYIDYHAYQPPNGGSVLNVRPLYFDDAGWPTFDICKAKGYKP